MSQSQSRLWIYLERILPLVVLLILVFLTYAKFVHTPYAGFLYSNMGQVVELYVEPAENAGLQLDDQLIQVGPIAWEDFETNPWQTLFDGAQPGSEVPLRIQRGDEFRTIRWIFPGPTFAEVLQRFNSQWWLSYVFWLAGVATMLLVRPKDTRQRLFIAFNFLTAIWLAAGGVAVRHTLGSIFILKSAIWLSVPVYLHLHFLFPQRLGRLPAFVLWTAYLLAFVLAIMEWLRPLPNTFYQLGFLGAVVGSLVLLIAHFLLRPAQRGQLRFLAAAGALALVPPIVTGLGTLTGLSLPFFIQGGAALALPAIPGAYFYTIYRQQLGQIEPRAHRLIRLYTLSVFGATFFIIALAFFTGNPNFSGSTLGIGLAVALTTAIVAIIGFAPFLLLAALVGAYNPAVNEVGRMRFRANQLLTPYLFFILLGIAIATISLTAGIWLRSPETILVMGIGIAILSGVATVVFYAPFQRFVEHRILGIPLPPVHLVEKYAADITTGLDMEHLTGLLKNEVLPSLSIRQSALLYFAENQPDASSVTAAYSAGVNEEALPNAGEVSILLEQAGQYRPLAPDDELQLYPWVRLVLPLTLGDKTMGLWLLGHRDPDDLYSRAEIPVFQTLANQTAIALTNILQAENLSNLYQANVGRHKTERVKLAWTLHDQVLNQVAALLMHVDEEATGPQFAQARQKLTANLRQIITRLRPPMFLYGLGGELEELVEDAGERNEDRVTFRFNIPETEAGYSPQVEENLFQIVQQAVDNALAHAQAKTIHVNGRLEAGQAHLQVEDDGIGFPADLHTDLATLVAQKHFGLAGMYERAQLINAELIILANPGHGTRIEVNWQDDGQLAQMDLDE